MYIVKAIHNKYAFHDEFKACGRDEQFSLEAFDALFEHLTEFAIQQDDRYELDVIAECCAWSEYETVQEAIDNYGDEIQTIDDLRDWALEILELPSGGILMMDF